MMPYDPDPVLSGETGETHNQHASFPTRKLGPCKLDFLDDGG